jgi:general secretion pathway protein M
MMRPLTKKQSRALAIGLLVLFVVICGLLVFLPLRMVHRHYDQSIESSVDYLGRYQRIVATRGEIQAALDGLKKMEGRKHFLKNTGTALAASEIQEIAKNLIESNGGRLISMQVVPQKEEAGYRRVTVNTQFFSNMTVLRKILYTLETAQPYLFVDNVSLRSQLNAFYRPNPGVEPELVTQFDLSGYALLVDSK